MRDFATIEDLIIPGDIKTLDPEIERQIIEYMENIHMQAITDEAEAIRRAREVLII